MNLVPIFEAVTKKYAINFYNHDHVIGGLPLFTLYSEYNKPLINVAKNEPKVYYLYRPDDGLDDATKRYTLKGWQSEADFNNNTVKPTLINLNTNVVTDMNLFAYYEIEDVTQNASPMEIFNISNNTVSLNNDYADLVGGKITIPSKDASGNNINMIGSFAKGTKISEIYFLPDAQHTGVGK
jgi:hypothetical protein